VLNVHDGMQIMQEEIFGPVLPIVTYRDLADAIGFVNARPRPLGLYYFGSSPTNQKQVLTRTTSGGVTINGTLLHYPQDDLPFGGVGASGFGAYHGIEGFRAFSHQKAVFEVGRWNGGALLRPPFGRLTNLILSFMLGHRGFGKFLQDQLRPHSRLFNDTTRQLFYAPERTRDGTAIPMTLGWHVGTAAGVHFHYKEGGGGGFHCMMRQYAEAAMATVVMTNATGFDVRGFLDAMDARFMPDAG
jgi:hypothetical protein